MVTIVGEKAVRAEVVRR